MTTSEHEEAGAGTDAAFHVFVSYCHADRKAAGRLQAFLQHYPLPGGACPLRVYLDETDIRSGELSNELGTALRRSKALIVCCSPASTESVWVSKEIGIFLEQGTRPVVPVVLEGDPEQVVPDELRRREFRYLDLRGRWWLNRLDPKGRIELARGIATITGRPLRDLVDWEKRRQRRFALRAGLACLGVLAGLLFYPLHYQRELLVRDVIGAPRAFEFAEVRDDGVLATVREISVGPQGGRNYVAYYPNVLAGNEWDWLEADTFSPRTRLVYHGLLDRQARNTLRSLPDEKIRTAVDRFAAERAREFEAEEPGWEADFSPRGPWIGEPVPGRFVILYVIPPVPADPADLSEGYVTPPAGDALVAVLAAGIEPRIARVEGFDPQTDHALGPRSLNLLRAVPVAAHGDDLWLGMVAREDGRTGGLWHSPSGGHAWNRVAGFASVASIAVDPSNPQRVLVARAPGRWKSGIREGVLEADLVVRTGPEQEWRPLKPAPPFGTTSFIQLAGFFNDGALAVQVDASLFELGRDNLARRLFGTYRRVAARPGHEAQDRLR
jgi:hypothetical protein